MIRMIVWDRGADALFARLEHLLSPEWLTYFLQVEGQSYLKMRARQRFATEGDDASGQWRELAPATPGFRAAQGFDPNAPINIRSREMFNWITNGAQAATVPLADGALMQFPATQPSGELGKKFKTAQRGKTGRGDGMRDTPARPILALGAADLLGVMTRLRLRMWGV